MQFDTIKFRTTEFLDGIYVRVDDDDADAVCMQQHSKHPGFSVAHEARPCRDHQKLFPVHLILALPAHTLITACK